MKTSLFIANAFSLILIFNFLLTSPSLTGFIVAPEETTTPEEFYLDITSPLGLAVIFIVTVTTLDIYFYRKSRHAA